MMTPTPTGRTPAPRHPPDRASYPDRSIDMCDPHEDCGRGRHTMDQKRDALRFYRRVRGEIGLPDYNAGHEQARHQQRHGPVDEFLAGVETAKLGKPLFLIR